MKQTQSPREYVTVARDLRKGIGFMIERVSCVAIGKNVSL